MSDIAQTIEAPKLYIPPGAISMDKADNNIQLRIGIQGYPKTGKTFGALTFPNPVVLSFDRGLVSHFGRKDVYEVPFYDDVFCDKVHKRDGVDQQANRKEAFTDWLHTHASKFPRSQTIVVDGGTGIQTAFHIWYREREDMLAITGSGSIDKYVQWRLKQEYFSEVFDYLKSIPANVVYVTHESPDRGKDGELNGKFRPLLTGQFCDELASHFTDWFRARVVSKPVTPEKIEEFKKTFQIDDATFKEWMAFTPPTCRSIYLWQTQSDDKADCATSMIGAPKYVLPTYQTFLKYQRKPIIQ